MVGVDNETNWTLSLDFILAQGTRRKAHSSIIHGSSVDEVCPLETTILLLFFQFVLKFFDIKVLKTL